MIPIKHLIKYSTCMKIGYGKRFSHCLICGVEILNSPTAILMCWTCWNRASSSLRSAANELRSSTSTEGVIIVGSLKEK